MKVGNKRMENNIIRVDGDSVISVYPNTAQITLGIITKNASLSKAQAISNGKLTELRTALTKVGIDEKKMNTTNFSIYPHAKSDSNEIEYYQVEHFLTITTDNIHKAGLIVDTAIENGANSVTNISFSMSKEVEKEMYKEALALAVVHAKEKAETIAETLKVEMNPLPISVIEQSHGSPYSPSLLARSHQVEFTPSEIPISATVTLEYRMKS